MQYSLKIHHLLSIKLHLSCTVTAFLGIIFDICCLKELVTLLELDFVFIEQSCLTLLHLSEPQYQRGKLLLI